MTTIFDKAALNLCKRSVTVRLQPPVWALASGAAYKTRTGAAVIDLDPGADLFKTFCHEAAHIRCQFGRMTPSDAWKALPGSLPRASAAAVKANLAAESQADRFASIWENYALRYAARYQANNALERRLKALEAWPKLDVESALELAEYQRQLEAAKSAAARIGR